MSGDALKAWEREGERLRRCLGRKVVLAWREALQGEQQEEPWMVGGICCWWWLTGLVEVGGGHVPNILGTSGGGD